MRKPINKLRIYNFFWKPETNPKNEETDPKKGNRSTNWEFKTFLENRKRTQKKWKPINKLRIYNFFWKSETDPKKEETDPKKGVIDQQTESSTHCTQVDNHEFHLLVSCKHMEKHRLSISLRTGQTLSSILHNRAAISKARWSTGSPYVAGTRKWIWWIEV